MIQTAMARYASDVSYTMFAIYILKLFFIPSYVHHIVFVQEYEDLDEYEEDGEEEEGGYEEEYEEEETHEPSPEELEYLELRQKLKERFRKKMKKELGTASSSRSIKSSSSKDK